MSLSASGSVNNIPVLNNRQLTSIATVPVGQTALLASEVSSSEMRNVQGLPGLSELPGFQSTTNDEQDGQHRRAADHHHAAHRPRGRPSHRQRAASVALQSESEHIDLCARAGTSSAATRAAKPTAATAECTHAAQSIAARRHYTEHDSAIVTILPFARILAILSTGRAGVAQW